MTSIWTTLGLDPTNDERDIRRAYARRLKQVHPEDDPEGFQRLREAHDQAMRLARDGRAVPRRRRPRPAEDAPAGPAPGSDPGPDPDSEGPQVQVVDWGAPGDRAWSEPPPSSDADAAGWSQGEARDWRDAAPGPAAPRPSPPGADDGFDPTADEQAHKVLCDRLGALLQSGEKDAEARLQALLAVLRSPAMGSLAVHERTEAWLSNLLGHSGTEELLEAAIAFFRWDDNRIGGQRYGGLALDRRQILILVRALNRPTNELNDAWRALTRPPTRLSRLRNTLDLGLDNRVRRLLELPQSQHFLFHNMLDPAALAEWRARLSRPRLPAAYWWTLGIVPALFAASASGSTIFGRAGWDVFTAMWIVVASLIGLAGAGWTWGYLKPRERWLAGDAWSRPSIVRLGWAAASVVLVLLAPFSPTAWLGLFWMVPAFIVLGVWARVTTAHLPRAPGPENALVAIGVYAPVILWVMIHTHGSGFAVLTCATAGATTVARLGAPALEALWHDLAPRMRERLGAAVAAAGVLVGAAIVLAPSWPLRAVAAALTVVLLLAARPMGRGQSEGVQRIRVYWLLFGWIPCLIGGVTALKGDSVPTFVGLGVWLLGGAVLTGVFEAAPRLDRLLRRRKIDKFG